MCDATTLVGPLRRFGFSFYLARIFADQVSHSLAEFDCIQYWIGDLSVGHHAVVDACIAFAFESCATVLYRCFEISQVRTNVWNFINMVVSQCMVLQLEPDF